MMSSLLIYEMPGLPDARAPVERQLALAAHRELQRDAKQSGAYVAASQLSESGATTVRRRKGHRDAGVPYEVPGPNELPQRLESVLTVVHLIFTEGHSASVDEPVIRP